MAEWCIYASVNKLIIGSDNGLSPDRRLTMMWTNSGILIIRNLETNFSEILREIHIFSFTKMYLKMSSAKWRPCLSVHEQIRSTITTMTGLFIKYIHTGLSLNTSYSLPEARTVGTLLRGCSWRLNVITTSHWNLVAMPIFCCYLSRDR